MLGMLKGWSEHLTRNARNPDGLWSVCSPSTRCIIHDCFPSELQMTACAVNVSMTVAEKPCVEDDCKPPCILNKTCQLPKKQSCWMIQRMKLCCGVLQLLLRYMQAAALSLRSSQEDSTRDVKSCTLFRVVLGSLVMSYAMQGGEDCCKRRSFVEWNRCMCVRLAECLHVALN